ncbi:unnamed protein product, partial [Nezara viridula]
VRATSALPRPNAFNPTLKVDGRIPISGRALLTLEDEERGGPAVAGETRAEPRADEEHAAVVGELGPAAVLCRPQQGPQAEPPLRPPAPGRLHRLQGAQAQLQQRPRSGYSRTSPILKYAADKQCLTFRKPRRTQFSRHLTRECIKRLNVTLLP